MYKKLKDTLETIREKIQQYYNKYRLKGPYLKEGNKIFLFARNIKIKRLSKKLNWKKIGLFKIKKKVLTLNYKLNLPSTIRLRSKVFHISLLKPALKKAKLNTFTKALNNEKFDIKEVLNSHVSNG